MEIIKKINKLTGMLWLIVIILIIVIFIFKFLVKNESVVNLLLGFMGVVAMLAVASHNFSKIDQSTKETTGAIVGSSKKQIEELRSFIQEIKETNFILSNVSKSLEIVSKDVQIRQKQVSILYATFGGDFNQIDIKSGEECEIELLTRNNGVIAAINPSWKIFFPPEIEVIEARGADIVPQKRGSKHEGYIGVCINQSTISALSRLTFKIKIKTEPIIIGLLEIPYSCSSNDSPHNADKLLINVIG